MARPAAKELTERELEVMHAFWNLGESTVADVRDTLAAAGLDRAYTTVATLVRILADKGFLVQTNQDRPFSYKPSQSYEEVSRKLLGDVIERVFRGSRELLLVRLMEQRALSAKERALLEEFLRRGGSGREHGSSDSVGRRGSCNRLRFAGDSGLPRLETMEPSGRLAGRRDNPGADGLRLGAVALPLASMGPGVRCQPACLHRHGVQRAPWALVTRPGS